MLTRRTLLRTGALAAGAATIQLNAFAEPVARTNTPGWIELDRNENPYGPPESSRKAMLEALARGNRYLDGSEFDTFRDLIAARENVTRDSVVIGAGSSEILWMAAAEYLAPGASLVLGEPTFELIGRVAQQLGATVEAVPVDASQTDDLGALEKKIGDRTRLVYVCHPNNPCGSMIATATMREFVKRASQKAAVLVDEAYLDYVDAEGTQSMAALVRAGENVIVARTFSKVYGLAGMRVGYAIARPDIAKRLGSRRFSAINSLGLYAASAALRDRAFADLARKRNDEGRLIITRAFDAAGIRYIPSSTSFLWFDESKLPDLAARLREARILIPNGRFAGGWNRVTIGTIEEVGRFAEELAKIVKGARG